VGQLASDNRFAGLDHALRLIRARRRTPARSDEGHYAKATMGKQWYNEMTCSPIRCMLPNDEEASASAQGGSNVRHVHAVDAGGCGARRALRRRASPGTQALDA